mgnify:FL=1
MKLIFPLVFPSLILMLWVVACGGRQQSALAPTLDVEATVQASFTEARAIEATAQAVPTNSPVPSTPTSTPIPPTSTPTPTPGPPTPTPTSTPTPGPPIPTPTSTPTPGFLLILNTGEMVSGGIIPHFEIVLDNVYSQDGQPIVSFDVRIFRMDELVPEYIIITGISPSSGKFPIGRWEIEGGLEYGFQVRSKNRYGDNSDWFPEKPSKLTIPQTIVSSAVDHIAPSKPDGFSGTRTLQNVFLNWRINNDSLDVNHTIIERSKDGVTDWETIANYLTPNSEMSHIDKLSGGSVSSAFYYRLANVDFSGNHSGYTSVILPN